MANTKKSRLNFRITPTLFAVDDASYKGEFTADPVTALYNAGAGERPAFDDCGLFLYRIAAAFFDGLLKFDGIELSREKTLVPLDDDLISTLLSSAPFCIGSENLTADWLKNLWGLLNGVFAREIASYDGTVAMYLAEKDSHLKVAEKIFFHIVENKADENYPFAFLATYSTKDKNEKIIHVPLKYALTEYKNNRDKILDLLACLNRAGDACPLIEEFVEKGEMFHPLKLKSGEAWEILKSIPQIEETGIVCRIPDWWKKKKHHAGVNVQLGEKRKSLLGLDSIIDMQGFLEVDGLVLSKEDVNDLLKQTEGLALIKGKWIEVNHEKLQKLLSEMEKYSGDISLLEAIKLSGQVTEENADNADGEISVSNGQWLKSIFDQLRTPPKIQLPQHLNATLRPYQNTGYSWLSAMSSFGFGACLADDMGLGKTLQILTLLESIYEKNPTAKILLIVPASLIGNWLKECEKFTPELPVKVLHGSAGKKSPATGVPANAPVGTVTPAECTSNAPVDVSAEGIAGVANSTPAVGVSDNFTFSFLNITTYGMTGRLESLKSIKWDKIILDEAQAIKNPLSKQTKNIKALSASGKIALTGTPVENDLSNLWSLFDFLDKGLLGTSMEFKNFTKTLSENPSGYAKLKKMISPFMLRRLKTDKAIISDLPEKNEITDYISFSKKQTVLYKKYVDELEKKLEKAKFESIERKGLVLSSLMKLKQICNHPDQFLGMENYDESDSGKFEMLRQICQTIYEKRERVLIFTQFKEITGKLDDFLAEIFGTRGFVLHGGTTVKKRTQMVEEFQSEKYIPYMVLSVKAGGTGLNLTNANHVIHFDRWWNPAVENQATDRAFRIGQTKNVMVHKFVCKGTIEEKIDELIESKKQLAKNVIGETSGESWISEMSNDELFNLLKLEV